MSNKITTLCETDQNGVLICDKEAHPEYFHCYECGSAPPKHISEMQSYPCVVCNGRKCHIHGIGDGERCYDCVVFDRPNSD